MANPESLIPAQHTGISKEIHEHIQAVSLEEADAIFNKAKARLLEVNTWAHTAEGTSAKFLLCDSAGHALSRAAQQGDLVRIDLPGPHRSSDSGYDWVILDKVAEGIDEHHNPWAVLSTRPGPDPTAEAVDDETAHFFSDTSTGTFLIRKRGLRVEGSHYGRNELPNTDGSVLDTARAMLVTAGAYLGLSDMQWSNLVKGLLSRD
jgi:hypothetical protein